VTLAFTVLAVHVQIWPGGL